jgi:hypothetical protein
MMKNPSLKDWQKQTKDSWLNQVIKDNPKIDPSAYLRNIDEGIMAKSFAFVTDIKQEGLIRKETGIDYSCKVGIGLRQNEFHSLKMALDLALENGVEYIHFILPETFTSNAFEQLIENVFLDMLVTRWTIPSDAINMDCIGLIKNRFPQAPSFFTKPTQLSGLNHTLVLRLPAFNLKSWIAQIIKLLRHFQNNQVNSSALIVETQLNHDFFLNISSLRAIKLVLNKIWKEFDLKNDIYFEANIDENILTMDVHSNVYKMASAALAASISGVDFLVLPPSDVKREKSELDWIKTSLHTQHIIKQESRISELTDPTAGSYFIEDLTEQIAENLWLNMQENLRND